MEQKYSAEGLLEDGIKMLAERGKQYDPAGKAERSMEKTVRAFSIITGKPLTEAEGWMLMAILKAVRSFQRPGFHADSAQDFVCYASLFGEAKAKEGGPHGEVLVTPPHIQEQREGFWTEERAPVPVEGSVWTEAEKISKKYKDLVDEARARGFDNPTSYLAQQLSEEAMNELRAEAFKLYQEAATRLKVPTMASAWSYLSPSEQRGWVLRAMGVKDSFKFDDTTHPTC